MNTRKMCPILMLQRDYNNRCLGSECAFSESICYTNQILNDSIKKYPELLYEGTLKPLFEDQFGIISDREKDIINFSLNCLKSLYERE